MSLLSLAGVSTFYGPIQALREVSLEVREGEIVTLIGANGAGKSTLMMTICGNPRARTGSITYAGEDITNFATHEIARRAIAQSPEGRRILAIARALMSKPKLLLLDEPSLGLAPLVIKQIFGAIRELNRQTGLTVLLVEQNANQALRLAHRGYVLVNGAITMAGSGAELLARPEIRAAYLEGGH